MGANDWNWTHGRIRRREERRRRVKTKPETGKDPTSTTSQNWKQPANQNNTPGAHHHPRSGPSLFCHHGVSSVNTSLMRRDRCWLLTPRRLGVVWGGSTSSVTPAPTNEMTGWQGEHLATDPPPQKNTWVVHQCRCTRNASVCVCVCVDLANKPDDSCGGVYNRLCSDAVHWTDL